MIKKHHLGDAFFLEKRNKKAGIEPALIFLVTTIFSYSDLTGRSLLFAEVFYCESGLTKNLLQVSLPFAFAHDLQLEQSVLSFQFSSKLFCCFFQSAYLTMCIFRPGIAGGCENRRA